MKEQNCISRIRELKEIFNKDNILSKNKVLAYCGSDIVATNIAFAIITIGYEKVTVYDASFS